MEVETAMAPPAPTGSAKNAKQAKRSQLINELDDNIGDSRLDTIIKLLPVENLLEIEV